MRRRTESAINSSRTGHERLPAVGVPAICARFRWQSSCPCHPHARRDHQWSLVVVHVLSLPSACPWGPLVNTMWTEIRNTAVRVPVGTTGSRPCSSKRGPCRPRARGDHQRLGAEFAGVSLPSACPWGPLIDQWCYPLSARSPSSCMWTNGPREPLVLRLRNSLHPEVQVNIAGSFAFQRAVL